MEMNELLDIIRGIAIDEYTRSAKMHSKAFNGRHEAYAVILEEYEEAVDEVNELKTYLDTFWCAVKNDKEVTPTFFDVMRTKAEHAAAEMIQVAAMCYKARTKGDREVK